MKTRYYYILIALGVPFTIWWYGYADCNFILHYTWTLRDVPTRCLLNK